MNSTRCFKTRSGTRESSGNPASVATSAAVSGEGLTT